MTSLRRIRANRRNARKSTGPRTAEGKARSKMNALKHGLDARMDVLPDEDEAAFRARLDAWKAGETPSDALEEALNEQAARLSWRLDRADRVQAAELTDQIRRAFDQGPRREEAEAEAARVGQRLLAGPPVPTYDLARIADRLARLADVPALAPYVPACDPYRLAGKRLSRPIHPDDPGHPEKLLRRLEATADGCRWLLGRWAELRAALEDGPGWSPAQRLGAVRLLGREPADAVDDPLVASIYLCGFAMESGGPAVFADQVAETTGREFDLFLQRLAGRGARGWVPTSPGAARAGLLALVDGIAAGLEMLAAGHEERGRARAATTADRLAFDDSPRGERLRRLQGRLNNAFLRTVDALIEARRRRTLRDRRPGVPLADGANPESHMNCEKRRNEANAAAGPAGVVADSPPDGGEGPPENRPSNPVKSENLAQSVPIYAGRDRGRPGRPRPDRGPRDHDDRGGSGGSGGEGGPRLGRSGPSSRMIVRRASSLAAGGGPRSPDRPDSSASADPGPLPPAGRPGNHRPMERSTVASRCNLDLLEDFYDRWRKDPDSVEASWRAFFEGYELGQQGGVPAAGPVDLDASRAQAAVTRLVDAYREVGHYLADLDPLKLTPRRQSHELLDPSAFGLSEADFDRVFYSRVAGKEGGASTLREVIAALRQTYCRTIGVEFMHIRDTSIRRWLLDRMEPTRNRPGFDIRKKRRIVYKLNAAELFETFLHRNYVGQKRFSLEGGEMLIPLLDAIIERAGSAGGVREIVMGMPHRGRLNVLVNILNKPYGMVFNEFEGNLPETVGGDGDVKYHLGFSADHVTADKQTVHLSLTPNPSHLEAVGPVVEGRMRAKQRRFGDTDRRQGLPILIHGDAAFAGQGLVAETLNLSQLPGYKTGGTIHIVVNNQIGFTTAPSEGRSTRYCTDVAKMIEVPIFHVNGEDPEAVVYVGELAMDFRQAFGKDVVIDMVCYRRHGHNEGDEPGFTQPLMYEKIKNRISIRELYTEQLVMQGELSSQEAETIAETFEDKLREVFEEVRRGGVAARPQPGFAGSWAGLTSRYSFEPVETGVSYETLRQVAEAASTAPEGFAVNPKLARLLGGRQKAVAEKGALDWSTAEMLAMGSLLREGTPVRLSGQDSRRGTFSQRHAVLVDTNTGERHIPLNHLGEGQAQFCVYDSLLSEAAVLGFDYGYSLDEPNMLIMWEAQFGDFANGAQVIIDQFIASAESKWGRASGLVMLLPHGYEGQGPEHSSARLERFLQLCAEENIQVAVPTTPAQYFHLLRRQVRRDFRKPLVVMTPKSLLRHKQAVSPVDHLTVGHFRDVLDDPAAPERARRVLLCSGKIYYDLLARRAEVGTRDVAIVRVEQLYPWPVAELKSVLDRYRSAREWAWVQEESQNMGAWTFAAPRLQELLHAPVAYVGRDASASPATGSKLVHDREQAEIVEAAIGAEVPHLVTAIGKR